MSAIVFWKTFYWKIMQFWTILLWYELCMCYWEENISKKLEILYLLTALLSIPLNEFAWPEVDSESISSIESKLVDWKRTLWRTGLFALGQDRLCSRVFCFETIFLAWVGGSNLIELSFLQQIRAKIPFRNLGKLEKK